MMIHDPNERRHKSSKMFYEESDAAVSECFTGFKRYDLLPSIYSDAILENNNTASGISGQETRFKMSLELMEGSPLPTHNICTWSY